MNEHRRFPRWQINQQARLKLEQAGEEVFCQVRDINYKGMGVVSGVKLPQDIAVRVNLKLSGECTFDAEVWVAWVKVVDGVNHYGLYFSRLRDADKENIYSFVQQNLSKAMVRNWWPEAGPPPVTDAASGRPVAAESPLEEQDKEPAEDHRIFERFPVNLSARYLNLDTGEEGTVNTQDVSAKGLGLAISEALKLHTALEIWLEIKNSGDPLYTRGEVVWVKKTEDGSYKLGVELEKADLMGISRVFKV